MQLQIYNLKTNFSSGRSLYKNNGSAFPRKALAHAPRPPCPSLTQLFTVLNHFRWSQKCVGAGNVDYSYLCLFPILALIRKFWIHYNVDCKQLHKYFIPGVLNHISTLCFGKHNFGFQIHSKILEDQPQLKRFLMFSNPPFFYLEPALYFHY